MKMPWTKIKELRKQNSFLERQLKSTTIAIDPDSFLGFALAGRSTNVNSSQAMQWYRENSSVATAVDLIADSFEQIDPVLQEEGGDFVDDSEVIELLNKPNGFQTWQEIAGQLSRHYLLTRDSHVFGLGTVTVPPLQLNAIKPQLVTPTESLIDGFPASYNVTQGAGSGNYLRKDNVQWGSRFYDGALKELYHIMGFSSRNNNISGDSPLMAAALETRQQISGRIHNLSMLDQGGRLSLLVSFKEETLISVDEARERKQRIIESFGGADGEKIAVISGPEVQIEELGKTNKDMDYAKLDNIAGHAIYLRYKIPLPLVSTDASTYNNMEHAITMLYDFAVLPLADTIFSGLSKFLLPRYKIDPSKFKITFNPDTIPALMTRRLEQIEKRRKMNIETINELREGIPNREPVDGGDVIYQPVNLAPIGSDPFEGLRDEGNTEEE